jgi:hypothetical protein
VAFIANAVPFGVVGASGIWEPLAVGMHARYWNDIETDVRGPIRNLTDTTRMSAAASRAPETQQARPLVF